MATSWLFTHVSGEFYATENFCPHKGGPLAEGSLCGHTRHPTRAARVGTPLIECGWHGWQFDVRSGESLTAGDRVETYRVVIEDRVIEIEV